MLCLLQLRNDLKCTTRTFIRLEKCSHSLLAPLPQNLIETKQKTLQLRQYYQQLTRQLILVQNLLQGLQFLGMIWRKQQQKKKSVNI